MNRTCQECKKENKGPYKIFCRSCYTKKWLRSIQKKQCDKCQREFTTPGKTCWICQDEVRKKDSRKIPCNSCGRVGLLILNMTEKLCTKCDRHKKEAIDPCKADKRRLQVMQSGRRKRGSDLNAPKKVSKGWWKTKDGYILMCKKGHPNANRNTCIFEHTLVMSDHLGRALTKDETVHHINGVRDDNRKENLELWSKSHPPGQRVEDKVKWAKEILEKYKEYC